MSRGEGGAATEVAAAVDQTRAGGPVVIVGDHEGTPLGALAMPAESVTAEGLKLMASFSSDWTRVAIRHRRLRELRLVQDSIGPDQQSVIGPGFAMSADLKGTFRVGMSDHVATIRALCDPASVASDFTRPGSVNIVAADDWGVLRRARHLEAGCDLSALAGRAPGAVLCALLDPAGAVAGADELSKLAQAQGFPIVRVQSLIEVRWQGSDVLEEAVATRLPVSGRELALQAFRCPVDSREVLVLSNGPVRSADKVPVHVHRYALLEHVFGAAGCRCHSALEESLNQTASTPGSVLVFIVPRQDQSITAGHGADCPPPLTVAECGLTAQALARLGLRSLGPSNLRAATWARVRAAWKQSVAAAAIPAEGQSG